MERAMDTYGPEDMVIPEVKLVQNVGGADAKLAGAVPGDFYCNVTGEILKGDTGLDIVVVDIPKNRTYWGRTEIDNDPPVCASLNGKVSMQGANCDECPYEARCDTPWLLDVTERRTKCLLDYNVLAIDARNHMPIFIRAGGISAKAAKELMTSLRMNREVHGEYERVLVHLTSQPKKTSQGDAFVMVFRATKLIEDETAVKEFCNESQQLLGVTLLPEGVTETEEVGSTEVSGYIPPPVEPVQEPTKTVESKPASEPKPEPVEETKEPKSTATVEPEPEPEPIDVNF